MPNLENIKRSTNDFSFTETVASLANNREYKSGYSDLKNGDLTDKAYFWQCLSAVGEDVGSVIYENVLNYIDNVANINTCRLKALTSIAKVLGVTEFAVLKNLKTIPQDVLSLMDIFSINRSYILNFSNFNTDFVQDLLSSTMDEESLENAKQKYLELVGEDGEKADDSRLSDVTIFGSLSNEKYEAYVEECFFNLLSKKLFQTYGNVPSDFIYENLSAQGNFSTTNELAYTRQSSGDESSGWRGVPTYNRYWAQETNVPGLNSAASFNNDYSTLIYRYKKSFGVSPGFNETQIVNDIEDGLDFLDNYQGGELSILKLEIDERAKTKFSRLDGYAVGRPDTRYSYYNECEVREYVKFIDDMYVLKMTDGVNAKSIDEISSSYLNWTPYYLSNNFSPYWLDTNFSNLSLETSATLSSNINSQYEIYKTDILSSVDVPFSSFVYDYYANAFQQKDEKAQILTKVNVVKIVAGILKDICMSVVNIREVLKTQAQRNYMTGTKLLIEYILDEYLVNMLINTYKTDPEKTKKAGAVGVQTIEYIDTTEYYNIDPEPGEAVFLKTRIHEPYFTNMKSGGFSGSETGLGLDPVEIRNFYLSSLNIHSRYISSDDDYFDFMSAVYSVGITKTFVGEGGALSIDKDYLESDLSIEVDIDELSAKHNFTKEDYDFFKKNWCLETDDGFKYLNYDLLNDYYSDLSDALEVISGDISKYNDALSTKIAQQTELMLKYHGTDIAYYPWYNYKNQDFPTFQAHPYLYNFIEHDPQKYPIENAFYGNANEDLIYELQSENISVYLGEAGNILRTWRNSNFDFSGYKSRYENSTHSYGWSNSSGLYSVTHYDGTFYPPAIDLYKKYAFNELSDPSLGLGGFDLLSAHMVECVDDGRYYRDQTNLDIGQISSMWHYYSHLGLTRAERVRITEQLIKLSTDILEMSDAEYRSKHSSSKAPYDVYKYGLDYNNNSIVLLKRYIEEDQEEKNRIERSIRSIDANGNVLIFVNSYGYNSSDPDYKFTDDELLGIKDALKDSVEELIGNNIGVAILQKFFQEEAWGGDPDYITSNVCCDFTTDIEELDKAINSINNKGLSRGIGYPILCLSNNIEWYEEDRKTENYCEFNWNKEQPKDLILVLKELGVVWKQISAFRTYTEKFPYASDENRPFRLPPYNDYSITLSSYIEDSNGRVHILYTKGDVPPEMQVYFDAIPGCTINKIDDLSQLSSKIIEVIPAPPPPFPPPPEPLSNPSYNYKRNTPGQLWIKFNSHPIGMPAFLQDELSSYSQVDLNNTAGSIAINSIAKNNALNEAAPSRYGSKKVPCNVYDFDLAANGQYLLYAVENPSENVLEKNYKNAVVVSSKIIQRKKANYISPDQEISRYSLLESGPTFLYPTNDGPQLAFLNLDLSNLAASDYEFDGFFQTNMYAYCGYFRRNPCELTAYSDILSSISINAIKYPSIKNASYNEESNSFAFQNSYDVDALSTKFAITKMDAPIRLGFVATGTNAPYFTLAVGSQIISGDVQRIQNFIGYNSQKISVENEEEEDTGTTDIFGCKKCFLSKIRDGNDTDLHCDYANDANPHARYDEQNNSWICECNYLQNDSYPLNPWGYYCGANQDIYGCQFTNSTSNRLLTKYIPDDDSGGNDSGDDSGGGGSGGNSGGDSGEDSGDDSGGGGSGGNSGGGSEGDSEGGGASGDGSGNGSGDDIDPNAGDDADHTNEESNVGGNGTTDYIEATIGDATCDSFDRFSHLITVYDIPTMTMIRGSEEKPYPAIYALNSDASYIPLYYGVDGQNLHYLLKDELSNLISYNYRWHLNDDNPNSDYTPRESIELLGYSFQDADRLISDKESSIYEDEDTGKQTSLDSASLVEGSLRVYEDYISDDFIYQEYNKGFLWEANDGDTREIEFDIGLSSLTRETASNYNVLILNVGSGKDRNPIVAGVFSEETISTCFYDADPTQEEESMLSSGYKLDNMVHIVGTPNPFNTKDTTFGLDYTNHLFNISGMSTSLSWTGNKPKITVTLTRREARDFAVQTDALLLLVYKNTLDQFDKYHYMEPTGLYPNNAAMSAWYMPWKDKNYPWLYEDGYDEEKDKWLSDPYYTDMRQRNIKYKNRLEKDGVRISSVVGISSNNSTVSTMSNIELSSLTSFDDSYFLSTGQITWKISEEDRLHSLKQKYPPLLVDSVLYDKFHGANKEHIDYNVFDLSSTYIFQLEDPLSIANKIGMIAVPIGTAADEFMLVYEDYLSDQVSVDVGGVNIMNYCEFVGADISSVDDVNAAINTAIGEDNTLNGAMNAANSLSFYAEESEKNDCKGTIDYFLLSATPEEISDYLKIYVNWRKYEQPAHGGHEHEDGIELFFNLPNLFISPYSYKTSDGTFSVEYKQGTYLRLKSGQDGYLYIVLQFKYYDSTGLIRGVRDLPILTYHIFNVSDDKPKFVIAKTFEIDNRDGRYTYPGDANENIVYIIVKNKTYRSQSVIDTSDGKHTLDDTIDWDNCFAYDLYLNTSLEVVSPIPLEYLNLEIAYERGRMGNTTLEADDSEFVFEPTLSKPGAYTESDGVISARIGTGIVESKLEFTLFNGSRMDPETLEKSFPIEILNAEGKDVNGNVPKFVLINGMISLNDYDTPTVPGAFLARELNLNKNNPYHEIKGFDPSVPLSVSYNDHYKNNAGWILEEQLSALIRMYTLGKDGKYILLDNADGYEVSLKTSGTRTSRFDNSSDLYILA